MRIQQIVVASVIVMAALLLPAACTAPGSVPSSDTPIPPTDTAVPAAATPLPEAATALPRPETAPTEPAREPLPFPLSEPGQYFTGTRQREYIDTARGRREVSVKVWYPALRPEGKVTNRPAKDAAPNLSAAPYPLLLMSSKVGDIFKRHLTSHGFVVAGVLVQDSSDSWDMWLIDYPLDLVFALSQIAASPPDGLEGVINVDRAGAMGYSFDGYTSLALSGARVDPTSYLNQCTEASNIDPPLPSWWIEYTCALVESWDSFAVHAGEGLTSSDDGLWQPMTDTRIRAVMPMALEGAWLFGERGLASVDRPTLIISASEDDINLYFQEAVYIFKHLSTPDRAMISFLDQGHMMVYSVEPVARMSHFATAFFGYHLQGRLEYADDFSPEFVGRHSDLVWGVHAE